MKIRNLLNNFSIHPGFGNDSEIWHNETLLFQGNQNEVQQWVNSGCPENSQDYDRFVLESTGPNRFKLHRKH